jgi:hypothetical protein
VADKPGHILEIPDSLGRDVDRAKEGKIAPPPMEAFMSDAALEQVEAQSTAAAAPVHAESLQPITQAEAGRRTTFGGETLPGLPSTRRVIPAPFRRPSINISHHGRTWQPCRAEEIVPGDTVPGVGVVASAEPVTRYEAVAGVPDVAIGVKVIITGISGISQAFDPAEQLQAHRLER